MPAYTPREDSFMLLEQVKRYSRGNVLDMGTGSGILAVEASKKAKKVIAADIDKNALKEAEKNAKKKKIKNISFAHSDLFSKIKKQKFDLIIFNPPYLPQDKGIKDGAIYGGEKGYETICRFLENANDYLKENGIILLLFSSLSKKERIDGFIEDFGFDKELLGEKPLFFERLYAYKIKKSELVKKLEKMNFKKIRKFAKGHRGIIYTAIWKDKKVAIKAKRPDSKAENRMENEAKWLRILNKKGIAQKLLFSKGDFFVYHFVEGDFIIDFVNKSSKNKIRRVLLDVLSQCRALDRMHVTKEEMHHPIKHVIVGKKTVLIDFERAHYEEFPKNVTQFCQFLISGNFNSLLGKKGIIIEKEKIIPLLKVYKSEQNEENFRKILKLI